MKKTLLFLFTLLATGLTQAQTISTTLCETDFEDENIECGVPLTNFYLQDNKLTTDLYNSSYFNEFSLQFDADLDEYDTVVVEFNIDVINSNNFIYSTSLITIDDIPNPICSSIVSLYETFPLGNENANLSLFSELDITFSNVIDWNFNENTHRLEIKFIENNGKTLNLGTIQRRAFYYIYIAGRDHHGYCTTPNCQITAQENQPLIEHCINDPENPCNQPILHTPSSLDHYFTFDNMKVTGIKNDISTDLNSSNKNSTRELIGSYNTLGQEVDASNQGVIINVYSDGTREMTVR